MAAQPGFYDVLTTTRSVRRRLDLERPVPVEIVGECLQVALQAPTGGHAEDWRWVVVGDAELKRRLGGLYRAAFEEHVLAPLAGARGTDDPSVVGRLGGVGPDGSADDRTRRILEGADHLSHAVARAPWLVLACATRPAPELGGGTWSAVYGSVYPAVWSFNLALRARGLGTCLTSLALHRTQEVADLLDLPPDVVQVTLLPVAWTLGTDFRPAARRPVAEVAFLDRWGEPLPYAERPWSEVGA